MNINKRILFLGMLLIISAQAVQTSLYRGARALYTQPGLRTLPQQAYRAYSGAAEIVVDMAKMRNLAQDALKNPSDLEKLALAQKELSRAVDLSQEKDSPFNPSAQTKELTLLWGKVYATKMALSAWLPRQNEAGATYLRKLYQQQSGFMNKVLGSSWVSYGILTRFPRIKKLLTQQIFNSSSSEFEEMRWLISIGTIAPKYPRNLTDIKKAKELIREAYNISRDRDAQKGERSEKTRELRRLYLNLVDTEEGSSLQNANEALGIAPAHLEADIAFAENILKNSKNVYAIRRAKEIIREAYHISYVQDVREGQTSEKTRELRRLYFSFMYPENMYPEKEQSNY